MTVDLTPEHVYRSCAEAAWEAPGTQRLWNGNQRETYIELMLARPDWRVLVDVAYRSGWGDHSTLVHDDRAAYQAGREDAAREIADKIEALKPSIKQFWDTADAARVYACNDAAKVARQISRGDQPRTAEEAVGDNPEEQRSALQHQERSEEPRRLERICQSCGQTARYCKCEQDL